MSILSKSLVLDGVFGSEHIDSSGEILDVKGCDISSLQDGTGVLNWEHKGDGPVDILGRVTYAKKIFGPQDCSNPREKLYWEQEQVPFIYGQVELFDQEGHSGAMAAAAIVRHYHSRQLPIQIRFSIEGQTLDRKGNLLKRSIARRVAGTIKPCNRSSHSGVLMDDAMDKNEHLLTKGRFYEAMPLIEDPVQKLYRMSEKLQDMLQLQKTLTLGSYGAAPSSLSGGAALQREHLAGSAYAQKKNQVLAAFRDWDRVTPIRDFLKKRLPDASDEYIERFASLIDDYQVKKSEELFMNLSKAIKADVDVEAVAEAKEAPMDPEAETEYFQIKFPDKDDAITVGLKDDHLVMPDGRLVDDRYVDMLLDAVRAGEIQMLAVEIVGDAGEEGPEKETDAVSEDDEEDDDLLDDDDDDLEYQEDPWDHAKYERGGEKAIEQSKDIEDDDDYEDEEEAVDADDQTDKQ